MLIKIPRLWAPGVTRMLVPVNLALSWSKPRAETPLTGQSMKKADIGGWCDVCSVMYETRIGLFFVPTCSVGDSLRATPKIGGAVSSTSQLH